MGSYDAQFAALYDCNIVYLGPLLLTWFNFNPTMDK